MNTRTGGRGLPVPEAGRGPMRRRNARTAEHSAPVTPPAKEDS
jgi:hypothetical protein